MHAWLQWRASSVLVRGSLQAPCTLSCPLTIFPDHPKGSIMSVSNTGGHGRGGQGGRIIGDVINHGKHDRWGKPVS